MIGPAPDPSRGHALEHRRPWFHIEVVDHEGESETYHLVGAVESARRRAVSRSILRWAARSSAAEGRQGDGERAVRNSHAHHQGGEIATTTDTVRGIDPETINSRTTVGVFFAAAKYRNRALIHHLKDGAWQSESWDDFREHLLAVASGLIDTGVKPGDCVVLIARTPAVAVLRTSPSRPSAPSRCRYTRTRTAEIAGKIVDNSGPRTRSRPTEAGVQAWRQDDCPDGRPVAALGSSEARPRRRRSQAGFPDPAGRSLHHRLHLRYDGRSEGRRARPPQPRRPQQCRRQGPPDRRHRSALSFLPYSHVFERINDIFVGMVYGGQAWISRGQEHLPEELHEIQPTVMCSVPRMYERCMRSSTPGSGRRVPRGRDFFVGRWAW
jgi:hypothetical protein